jgi:hypothetical protein
MSPLTMYLLCLALSLLGAAASPSGRLTLQEVKRAGSETASINVGAQ